MFTRTYSPMHSPHPNPNPNPDPNLNPNSPPVHAKQSWKAMFTHPYSPMLVVTAMIAMLQLVGGAMGRGGGKTRRVMGGVG